MDLMTRIFLAAAVLTIDLLVFFVPLAGVLTAYVLVMRPAWFPRLVEKIYS